MRLLERASPLGSLAACVSEARRGDGRLVLVAGEAGVGKSALVEQLQREVPDAHWSWGRATACSPPRPLRPLFDLADKLGGELLGLCQAGAAREELFRALLSQVGEPGTLNIVVVEDIHWADEATIDLLRFLGRRIQGAPVLLIATYRDDGLAAGDPLLIALGDLVRQRSTRRVRLAPLSAARGCALGVRSIPAGPRTATRAHPKQLTRRESEVLDLICAGYTNAAISAELFISAKTVDHHVSAILAKLGAPNRNAAAAQAARLGLVGGAGAAGNAGLRSPRRRAAADLRCRARSWPPPRRPWRDTPANAARPR
jgi:DNA-binding NarL/FixJ family response regulator